MNFDQKSFQNMYKLPKNEPSRLGVSNLQTICSICHFPPIFGAKSQICKKFENFEKIFLPFLHYSNTAQFFVLQDFFKIPFVFDSSYSSAKWAGWDFYYSP